MSRDEIWSEIEREAHEQVQAELARDESTPLVFGAPIAWSYNARGRTDGVSEVHRVGFPQFNHAYTTCGELIPAPIRWCPLSPAVVRVMAKCQYCEAEMARVKRERAA